MSIKCKFCGSGKLMKNGFTRGIQRYKCRECGRNPIAGDKRYRMDKYDARTRHTALLMYVNNAGFRQIERVLKVHNHLVASWVKSMAKQLNLIVDKKSNNKEPRNIEILEMDELFTYIKKSPKEYEYGLLLIGTEMKLVHLRSEQTIEDMEEDAF